MVAHTFTLLSAPSASKLANFSRDSAVRLKTFERIRNRRRLPLKTAILPFSNSFQRFTVDRQIYQFRRKRCQNKHKDVSYQLLQELLQKYFAVNEGSAVKNAFSTYVWSKVDSCFREALYISLLIKIF